MQSWYESQLVLTVTVAGHAHQQRFPNFNHADMAEMSTLTQLLTQLIAAPIDIQVLAHSDF